MLCVGGSVVCVVLCESHSVGTAVVGRWRGYVCQASFWILLSLFSSWVPTVSLARNVDTQIKSYTVRLI